MLMVFEPGSLSCLLLIMGIIGITGVIVAVLCRVDWRSRSKRAKAIIGLSKRHDKIDAKIQLCLIDACGDYNLVDLDLTDMDLAHGYDILFFEEDVT